MQPQAWELVRLSGFEPEVASCVTIREALGQLAFRALTQTFESWMQSEPVGQ